MVFFDRFSQGNASLCGDGMVFCRSHYDFFLLKLGMGGGLNTQAKLLALWGLLSYGNNIQFNKIQIDGDSKIVVDWFEHKCNLRVMALDP